MCAQERNFSWLWQIMHYILSSCLYMYYIESRQKPKICKTCRKHCKDVWVFNFFKISTIFWKGASTNYVISAGTILELVSRQFTKKTIFSKKKRRQRGSKITKMWSDIKVRKEVNFGFKRSKLNLYTTGCLTLKCPFLNGSEG